MGANGKRKRKGREGGVRRLLVPSRTQLLNT